MAEVTQSQTGATQASRDPFVFRQIDWQKPRTRVRSLTIYLVTRGEVEFPGGGAYGADFTILFPPGHTLGQALVIETVFGFPLVQLHAYSVVYQLGSEAYR